MSVPLATPIQDREQAYACLAAVAEFLRAAEPHSPVPHMVELAIEWGKMDAAALYQELFLRRGGQISIFDLVGLSTDESPPT